MTSQTSSSVFLLHRSTLPSQEKAERWARKEASGRLEIGRQDNNKKLDGRFAKKKVYLQIEVSTGTARAEEEIIGAQMQHTHEACVVLANRSALE